MMSFTHEVAVVVPAALQCTRQQMRDEGVGKGTAGVPV